MLTHVAYPTFPVDVTYRDAVSNGVDLLEDTSLDVPFRRVGAVAVRLRQTDDVELRQRTWQCFINQ